MDQTLEDRLAVIRENLKAGSARLMDVSGSFRVDFPSGHSVYIYSETYDNSITARFETKSSDPSERRREADQLRNALDREISFADIRPFKESQALKSRFVYTTRVDVDPNVFFHETIIFGDRPAPADAGTRAEPVPTRPIDVQVMKSDAGADLSLAEEAVAALETIDPKILRLSLDMMNLKRSSTVRLALTRIFRDALDAEALISAIDNEAGKLTSDNDREELVMVKAINTDEALEPVIRLLFRKVFGKDPGD